MKFDKIIMNPPYSKNLHLKILAEAIKHLKNTKDAELVSLEPAAWITNSFGKFEKEKAKINYREKLSKHIYDLDLISKDDFNKIFSTSNFFGVGIFKFKKEANNNFDYKKYWSNNKLLNKLLEKIVKLKSLRSQYKCKDTEKHFSIPMRRTTHHNLTWYSEGNEKCSQSIYFDTEKELINFKNSLDTWLYDYLNKCEWNDGANSASVPWMGDCINPRTGLKGYKSEWTNEDFYKYFEITEDEQKLIEKTMEKYK